MARCAQNFPFKYHNKKPFVAKLLGFTGVAFGVPFAAVEYKKCVPVQPQWQSLFIAADTPAQELFLIQYCIYVAWRVD